MISRSRDILSLDREEKKKSKTRTEWYFKLRRELDGFADLDYATRSRVVQEALEMKDENGWERLDQHLLARFTRARGSDLHGLRLRDVCECVLDCVYGIALKEFGV